VCEDEKFTVHDMYCSSGTVINLGPLFLIKRLREGETVVLEEGADVASQ
jgi:hypothetical protein